VRNKSIKSVVGIIKEFIYIRLVEKKGKRKEKEKRMKEGE
jgi:hypothetical protein